MQGTLPNGKEIAVRAKSGQGIEEFQKEVILIAKTSTQKSCETVGLLRKRR